MKLAILFVLVSLQLNAAWKKIDSLASAFRHPFMDDDSGSQLGYYDVTSLPDGRIMLSFGFRNQAVRDELFFQFFPSGYSVPFTFGGLTGYFGGQVVLGRAEAVAWFQAYRALETPALGLLPTVRLPIADGAPEQAAAEIVRRAIRGAVQVRAQSMAPGTALGAKPWRR